MVAATTTASLAKAYPRQQAPGHARVPYRAEADAPSTTTVPERDKSRQVLLRALCVRSRQLAINVKYEIKYIVLIFDIIASTKTKGKK